MIVKIQSKIYNSEDIPIIIKLSDSDKQNISNMDDHKNIYCSYPSQGNFDSNYIYEEMVKFKNEVL